MHIGRKVKRSLVLEKLCRHWRRILSKHGSWFISRMPPLLQRSSTRQSPRDNRPIPWTQSPRIKKNDISQCQLCTVCRKLASNTTWSFDIVETTIVWWTKYTCTPLKRYPTE